MKREESIAVALAVLQVNKLLMEPLFTMHFLEVIPKGTWAIAQSLTIFAYFLVKTTGKCALTPSES